MKLTKEIIKKHFRPLDYSRGLDYYRRGLVSDFYLEQDQGALRAGCTVEGHNKYFVRIREEEDMLCASCSCPQFDAAGVCKHIVAAFLTLADGLEEKPTASRSNAGGRQLLHAYQSRSKQSLALDPARKARLVPRIQPGYGGSYPTFSFQVGFERLYVVKDIRQFLTSVLRGETVTYGKNLTFYHHPEQFDEPSRRIIALLMDEFAEFRNPSHRQSYSYYDSAYSRDKNLIVLTGDSFDRWFEFFQGQAMELAGKRDTLTFEECDPQVTVSLTPSGQQARIGVSVSPSAAFFGNHRSLYALGGGRLLRCSRPFQERVYPMLSIQNENMVLAHADLPAFCSFVLPEIQDLVALEDAEGLLNDYLPDPCTACYYFDMQDGVLTASLAFRYGETQFPAEQPADQTPGIKRDAKAEQAALRPMVRYLLPIEGTFRFCLEDEDKIFTFLTEHLERFHDHGEVYVSQSLRSKRVDRKGAQVGISVSGGILTLELDTGEFPPEELEALYQSLLKKKTYHRLADGRYLELDGSPYEALAEAAHMLQLSPKELRKGQVTMPDFRAPYLDSVLGEQEALSVHRDQSYRALLREFKSVADSDYVLPERFDAVLRPYQKFGFQWLKTLEARGFGGILADEMGLGKTIQMIAFLSTATCARTGLPSLVVCPASLILNWADECARFAPELKVRIITGTAAERKQLIQEGGECDLWVTSYDLLKRDREAYGERGFYCVILDEGQYIKNKTTLASKAVKEISCRQRFVLTGTPIENRLSELWNLFDFLMPGYLFSHTAFVEKLEKPVAQSKDPAAGRRLSLLVQPFLLRRLKQDVLKELPPKIEHVHRVQLSEEERKTYLAFTAAARRSLAEGEQGKLQILAALTRLRQLCCDPNLCLENYGGETSKLDACVELCARLVESGHQVLLFSQFTTMLERLASSLNGLGISSFTLQGSTPRERRAQLVKDFNAGGASVFLISLKAGGTGLNLTAADAVIHYDPWWNLAAQNQATDRAHRIGQQTTVHVYKLIAKDTIEEKILELQSRKAELMDVVASQSQESLQSLSDQELLDLFE